MTANLLTKLRFVQSFCDESGRTDLGQIALDAIDELARRPEWNGAFEKARQMASEIVNDHSNDHPSQLIEKFAETLVETWYDGALVTECLYQKPHFKHQLLIKLLREHGIGILSLEELQAKTLAVARGKLKLPPDEPKLSFSSIEAMVACLKKVYEKREPKDLGAQGESR